MVNQHGDNTMEIIDNYGGNLMVIMNGEIINGIDNDGNTIMEV